MKNARTFIILSHCGFHTKLRNMYEVVHAESASTLTCITLNVKRCMLNMGYIMHSRHLYVLPH